MDTRLNIEWICKRLDQFANLRVWAISSFVVLIACVITSGSDFASVRPVAAQDVKPASISADSPVTNQDLDQERPAAIFNDQVDEYVVVYEHEVSATDHDIHGRRVGQDGVAVGLPFLVVNSYDSEEHPAIAYNSTNNEYLVTWERKTSGGYDIRAQRISSLGLTVGSEFGVATTSYDERRPAVAYNATRNEYMVVWEEGPGIDTYSIRARRVRHDGTLLGSVISVGIAASTTDAGDEAYEADVAWDSYNDRYLVVWAKYAVVATVGDHDIVGKRIGWDGTAVGGLITVEGWEYKQLKPRAVYNPHKNEFLVVWEDHHWGWGADSDIYARRIDDSGVFNSDPFGVAWEDAKLRLNPVVAYKASVREYMVVWEYAYSATDHDIFCRRLDGNGALLEPERSVRNSSYDERHPTVAADDADRYLVAWEDSRNAGSTETDIYGALMPTDYFSGHVYDGTSWTGAAPLAGATVELYCSNSAGSLGTKLETTTTDATGGYQLTVVRNCEFWHIVETDPTGYQSVASRTSDGSVITSNHLRYAYPLTGKSFNGNDFLDTPDTPADTLPPGNWTAFSPAGWVTDQTVTASVRVEDTGTGLAVTSAEFAYSTDSGASWSDWRPATCTGSDGTNAPQTVTAANVPFGQDSAPNGKNRIKFRVQDMAESPNMGVSPVFSIAVDSLAPAKPTGLTSGSHTTSVWSKDNTIDAKWNPVTDPGSGLAGYSIQWSKATNTVPDAYADLTATASTSQALEDTDLWYVHLRAVDNAGNASGTAHLGPFFIDTLAPITSVGFLDPYQGTATFTVDWSEATTYGSPLTGFDIRVVDTWDTGSKTTTWQSNTTSTSAAYTGVRGHTYAFYSRARDAAGNQETYPAKPDATTTIGKDMVVVVVDEANKRVADAQTFLNGRFVGGTNGNGEWVAKNVMVGDEMAARLHVHTQNAAKPHHKLLGFSGANWSWNVYITSVGFDAAGNPQLFQVNNLNQSPTLKLRKSQTLIGFHFMVSVEWDASPAYLDDLEEGLESASAYLYDISDGQMVFETIEVWDNRAYWGASDMRVHATNQVWPCASVNGITKGTDKHIYMGRFFNGNSSNSGQWKASSAFRTIIHEFGHYGMAFYDEYLDRDGDKTKSAFCATNFDTTPTDRRASFMYYQYTATEMCSTVDPNHTHRTNTLHDAKYGECLWESLVDKFEDSGNRWLLRTPVDRGAVMAGPNAVPVDDWDKVYRNDADTKPCAPFQVKVDLSDLEKLSPVKKPSVLVDPKCSSCPDLYQGSPDASNNLTIYGAHNGDSLRVAVYSVSSVAVTGGPFYATVTSPIQCTAAAGDSAALTLKPTLDPFALDVTATPAAEGRIRVQVEASTALAGPPSVELWQTGTEASQIVKMTASGEGTGYQGVASLDPAHEPSGYLYVTAQDTDENTVWRYHDFAFRPVTAGELDSEIYSTDGVARLVVRPDSFTEDAVISLQNAAAGSAGALEQMTDAYAIVSAGGTLATDATLHVTYDAVRAEDIRPDSIRLYRWDGSAKRWVGQESVHDSSLNLVSARVSSLGTFALFGQKAGGEKLLLPVITNQQGGAAAGGPATEPGGAGGPVETLYLPSVR